MPETFISNLLRHTSIYESPTSFWKWSAYATVAAVLRDNCYLPQGDRKLFPNIYVLLLAESSGHRKGPPVDMSESLVTKVNNTKTISGRTSVQAIMDELSRAETDKKTGTITKAGSAIFYAAELSAGIVEDPAALKILTDIYDYKSNAYKNRLRTGPSFNIDRIVLSMLAASNEDMIKAFFDIVAIKGGMLARTFLITPNEFRKPNSLMRLDKAERVTSMGLVTDHIMQISKLKGEFVLTEEAITEYEGWYEDFRKSYQTRKETSGIIGRIHTSVLKLALILAANDLSLTVTAAHMEKAIDESITLIPNYSVFTMSNGKSDREKLAGVVVADLLAAKGHTLTRKDIVRKNWQIFDEAIFEGVISTLETAGMITQLVSRDGTRYKLTAACLEMMGAVGEKRVGKENGG